MNLADLESRLRTSVKNPDEGDKPRTQLIQYINDGYRDVFSRYPFHQARKICTFLTVVGQPKYQMPPDLSAILSISNRTNGGKIFKSDDDHVIERHAGSPLWRPRLYIRYRNYIHLVPTPDAVYVIAVFYKYIPTLLVADLDAPSLPEDWHIGIMLRARWYYFMEAGDSQQATVADNNYKLWAMDKPTEIEEETVDQDQGIRRPELSHIRYGRSWAYDDGTFDYGGW